MAITRDSVVALIDLAEDDDASVWIDYADVIMDETPPLSTLTTGRQDAIRAFLAAHFAAQKYERGAITRDRQMDADQSYQEGPNGMQGLAETRFGRQAIALDATGSLQALARKPLTAEFRVV